MHFTPARALSYATRMINPDKADQSSSCIVRAAQEADLGRIERSYDAHLGRTVQPETVIYHKDFQRRNS